MKQQYIKQEIKEGVVWIRFDHPNKLNTLATIPGGGGTQRLPRFINSARPHV